MKTKIDKLIKQVAPLKLLFVEDDAKSREATEFLLGDFFSDIIVAVDGKDGIQKFKENKIDLIITDINMPKLDGLGMISEIKKIDKDMLFIVLSSHIRPEYFVKSINLNVDAYLIKPIELDLLLETLENITATIKEKEKVLEKRQAKKSNHKCLQAVVDNTHHPLMVIAKDYNIKLTNNILKEEYNSIKFADKNNPKCYEMLHHRSEPCDGTTYSCPLVDVLQSNDKVTIVQERNNAHTSKKKFIEVVATPQHDYNEEIIGIFKSSRDITEYIQTQKELAKHKILITNDGSITNKLFFSNRLEQAILIAKTNSTKIALLLINLDKFTLIDNDDDDDAKDNIVKIISKLIKQNIRKSDTVAQLDSSEFAVMMEDVEHENDHINFANKILNSIEVPIEINSKILNISASIGISIYPDHTDDHETLLNYAGSAISNAKDKNEKIIFYNMD